MYLKCSTRRKDGKEHRTWSIVESQRLSDGRCVQRQVLYLGEINDSQRAAWQKSIAVFDEERGTPVQMAIFPEDRLPQSVVADVEPIQIRLSGLSLHRPRQWGGCWLAIELWRELQLDRFWMEKLPASREGTRWDLVLTILSVYRLLDPGSEWRLHRQWFERSAMADLLGCDSRLVVDDTLYRCLDKLLAHKEALFSHLQERWRDLFGARFEVLLYDLTSTYFESNVPQEEEALRRFGYSRDKRGDCVQVIIALVVTPEGLPLGYEVMPGNTSDKSTLRDFLARIEKQYGKADRTWIMDRGIPTEEVLEEMRKSTPPVHYLVGTPRGRLSKLEGELLKLDWKKAREGVDVKLLRKEGELYVLAKSHSRVGKERGIRSRKLKKLWARLHELKKQELTYPQLLLKLGATKAEAGNCWNLVEITLPDPPAAPKPRKSAKKTPEKKTAHSKKKSAKPQSKPAEALVTFSFSLRKEKLRQIRRREGHYLLRSNLPGENPAELWQHYITLTEIEGAFRTLKGDLGIRPVYHHRDDRIQAHIFVCFLAYCLQVTLRRKLHALAPGLSPRAALEKFTAMSMVDVHLPTTDGRTLLLSRYTHPDKETLLLLDKLKLSLPAQPPPKITTPVALRN